MPRPTGWPARSTPSPIVVDCKVSTDWALDEEIKDHYVKDRDLFGNDFILGLEDGLLRTEGKGTVRFPVLDQGRLAYLRLKETRHTPSSTINFISWKKLEKEGLEKLEDDDGNWMVLWPGEEVPLFWCQKPSGPPCAYQWLWILNDVIRSI